MRVAAQLIPQRGRSRWYSRTNGISNSDTTQQLSTPRKGRISALCCSPARRACVRQIRTQPQPQHRGTKTVALMQPGGLRRVGQQHVLGSQETQQQTTCSCVKMAAPAMDWSKDGPVARRDVGVHNARQINHHFKTIAPPLKS